VGRSFIDNDAASIPEIRLLFQWYRCSPVRRPGQASFQRTSRLRPSAGWARSQASTL